MSITDLSFQSAVLMSAMAHIGDFLCMLFEHCQLIRLESVK
jgi:hypothetical protein